MSWDVTSDVQAFVNDQEISDYGWQIKDEVRFGWFDSVNDQAVATALFNAVAEFGREHGMEHMTGPEGFWTRPSSASRPPSTSLKTWSWGMWTATVTWTWWWATRTGTGF